MPESAEELGSWDVRRLRVTGRVQGVGFRWFVRQVARAHGVRGWVRNEPNGDVLTEFAGSAEAIQALEEAIARGPDGSRVDRVVTESPSVLDTRVLPAPFVVER